MKPSRLLCTWTSPGKNTGTGSQSLLWGTFLTQGSNLALPHCRRILYRLTTGEALPPLSSVQFSRSVVSDSLRPHEPQHARPPCPSPTPRLHPNPCHFGQISSLLISLLHLQRRGHHHCMLPSSNQATAPCTR